MTTKDRKAARGLLAASLLLVGILLGFGLTHLPQSVEMRRGTYLGLQTRIQQDLQPQHLYRCCLMKPCGYCIGKTPEHGEGASCDCLADVVNGEHPCGECIGEILEGHGSPYLAEYYAKALADELGEQHLPELRRIIAEKYGMPIEEQA